jgi:predicted NUDIX family phosphoesterase
MWFQICSKDEKFREYFVQIIGYCNAKDEQISIYEYMPGGTLQRLHGELFHIVQCKE